eukprot:SAG31_NODE_11324_length_1042_cov_0.968187_1_plen_79_part_01
MQSILPKPILVAGAAVERYFLSSDIEALTLTNRMDSQVQGLVEQITADNDQPVPKEALDSLVSVVESGADDVLAELSRL